MKSNLKIVVTLAVAVIVVWFYVSLNIYRKATTSTTIKSTTTTTTTTPTPTTTPTLQLTTTFSLTSSSLSSLLTYSPDWRPNITREIVDFYPGPSRLVKPRQISCSDILNRVKYIGGHAFARGYVKEVWLGELDGKRLIVKRPAMQSDDGFAVFDEMLTKEIALVRELRPSPFIMGYHGACRGVALRQFQAVAVEGPLVNWGHLVRSSLSWSGRLKVAVAFLDLLAFFERKLLAHCDWKGDQVAVDLNFNVKLVDLKSLRKYSVGHGVDRGKNCTSQRDCVWASGCFKWQFENNYAVPELECAKDGFCVGFLAPSMTRNSLETFLWPLLSQWVRDVPVASRAAYESTVEEMYRGVLTVVPRDRWTAERAKQRLVALSDELDVARHFGDGSSDRRVLANLIDGLTSSANLRCESRFC